MAASSDSPTLISRDSIGIAFVLLSGVGVIFLPTTAKLAYQSGSDVFTVAFVRGVIAGAILLVTALMLRQRLRLPRELMLLSIVVGLAGVFFVYGMLGAIMTINIGLAVLILYLCPIVVAAYEHYRGDIQLHPLQWLWALVAGAGLALILGVRFEASSLVGISLSFMAMLAVVVITLGNVRLTNRLGSVVANLHMTLWGLLIFALVLLASGDFREPQTLLGWSGLFGNGVAYCVAWVAFFAGARILGATRASMVTLFEPILAAGAAWLIFAENFSPLQWVGFAVVMLALFLFEYQARRG